VTDGSWFREDLEQSTPNERPFMKIIKTTYSPMIGFVFWAGILVWYIGTHFFGWEAPQIGTTGCILIVGFILVLSGIDGATKAILKALEERQ
jgi:hypothetical protein